MCSENLKKNLGTVLLDSTANPAQFEWKWAGLAAPKSQTQFFSNFQDIYFFNYFIKNPQTTIASTFLTHTISAIGAVIIIGCIN